MCLSPVVVLLRKQEKVFIINFYCLFLFLFRKEYQSPLDLPSLLHASVLFSRALETIPSSHLCSPVQHIFWKLTFVYPDQSKLSQRESAIVQWLHYKLQFRPQEKENEAVHSPLSPKEPQLLSLSVTSTTPGGAADSSTAVDWQTKLCLVVNGVSEESLQKKEEGLTREHRGTCAMAIFLPTPKYSHDSTEAHVHVCNRRTVCCLCKYVHCGKCCVIIVHVCLCSFHGTGHCCKHL